MSYTIVIKDFTTVSVLTRSVMTNMLINNFTLAAALNKKAFVYCIDGARRNNNSGLSGFENALKNVSGDRFRMAFSDSDIIDLIKEIYTIFDRRKKQSEEEDIFVIIKNIQYIELIKNMFRGIPTDESAYSFTGATEVKEDLNDLFSSVNSYLSAKQNPTENVTQMLLKMIDVGYGYEYR